MKFALCTQRFDLPLIFEPQSAQGSALLLGCRQGLGRLAEPQVAKFPVVDPPVFGFPNLPQ